MISAGLRDEIAGANWFAKTEAPYLLVNADHRIVAANSAYQAVTGHPWSVLAFEQLFDVFPDNPEVPEAGATANLGESIESVLRGGGRDWMGVQRYDVRNLAEPGRFVRKVWVPVNTPIAEGGRPVAVLHHVEDVTDVCGEPGPIGVNPALEAEARRLWPLFPALSFRSVLGVATHSCLVSTRISSAAHMDTARRLAVMRLELLAGHPAGEE